MPDCCICYTVDPGYLLPTLVSAQQARRHADPAKADIAIFSLGCDGEMAKSFGRICAAENIQFIPFEQADVDGAGAMLARLFLDRLAPEQYGQLLYIDGDTQITGALDPLLAIDVPQGSFYAATDPMSFSLAGNNRHDRDLVEYFNGIGIPAERQKSYFNSGVLRINRDGWDRIGARSFQLYKSLQNRTRFPDQDALNIVGSDHRLKLSLAWNFPIFLQNARVEHLIRPRIIHYMGSPKPWHGSFPPWGFAQFKPYIDIVTKYPELSPHLSRMRASRKFKYALQQRYKRGLENLTWGQGRRRMTILNYEKSLPSIEGGVA
jgi:lipopolysaccharide biosynthesis glycosyltransferase